MKIFISGTDTNIGKTLVSSWLALHTGFAYFKPIQTGSKDGTDSEEVARLSKVKIYPETYIYREPLSPHLAARIENEKIDIDKIILPREEELIPFSRLNQPYEFARPSTASLFNIGADQRFPKIRRDHLKMGNGIIVEGAGGLLVPINDEYLMIDLIKKLGTPLILVSSTKLGTINHTLLSLEALRSRNIEILGVIMNGENNVDNKESIEKYGNIEVLAEFPLLKTINHDILQTIKLPEKLAQILAGK